MKGYVHSIETFGTVDGPGTRFVIFLQGCPLKCIYCHNPDTWKAKTGNKMSVGAIVKQIKSCKNYLTNGGVTISGGEPLLQAKFVNKLINAIHKLGLHIAIDTAGSIFTDSTKKVLKNTDLILLDIKALETSLHQKITGSTNINTLSTLSYLDSLQKPVWIRHVLVPKYTLDTQKLQDLAKYLTQFKCIEIVELLPFHQMGKYKWEDLKIPYVLKDSSTPIKAVVDKAKAIFVNCGFKVR